MSHSQQVFVGGCNEPAVAAPLEQTRQMPRTCAKHAPAALPTPGCFFGILHSPSCIHRFAPRPPADQQVAATGALSLQSYMHKGCSRDAQGIDTQPIPDSQGDGKPVARRRGRPRLRVARASHPAVVQHLQGGERVGAVYADSVRAGTHRAPVECVTSPPGGSAPCSVRLCPVNGQGRGLLPLALREVGELDRLSVVGHRLDGEGHYA